jgi:phosphoglycolate phosphatase
MTPRLILFDIDGTILSGGPLWREAFIDAFAEVFPAREVPKLSFAGKTDGSIVRDVARHFGASDDELMVIAERVHKLYLEGVKSRYERQANLVKLLPGVRELVQALSERTHVHLALLTGNLELSARLKLKAVEMESYFDWGVFADDHWDRYELPGIARMRAHQKTGRHYGGREIVIIGDTVHDVHCGRSLGVKTIAVGTGPADARADVLAAGADHFFENFADTRAVLSAIVED